MQDILTRQIQSLCAGRVISETLPALLDNLNLIYKTLNGDKQIAALEMIEKRLDCWQVWDNHKYEADDRFPTHAGVMEQPQTEIAEPVLKSSKPIAAVVKRSHNKKV